MVEEVGDLELGDGLPEGELQEPFYGVRMNEWNGRGCESSPEMGALAAHI